MLKPFTDAAGHSAQLRADVDAIAAIAASGDLDKEQEMELVRLERAVDATMEAISRLVAKQMQSGSGQRR